MDDGRLMRDELRGMMEEMRQNSRKKNKGQKSTKSVEGKK
jgi:hypothetical protein